jgi:leucyl-tRNA synthetase
MPKFDHKKIEQKWQKRWEKERVFEVAEEEALRVKKYYVLDMFPYPSAAGLHVGHPEGYTASDIIARKRRMEGYHVLHPMGWDAFGLPAENYAIKTGVHPSESTAKNIDTFRRQIKSLGFSYDWSREVNTSDPAYYRWTQWLFLLLYKHGLAYRALANVNWCPSCNTVLANEQVIDGRCERCKHEVVQKELKQWFFRITKYADRLLADLEKLDWPEKIKVMQRNWIGRSEGVEVNFKIVKTEAEVLDRGARMQTSAEEFDIPVFTTRADTLFGVSYIVLAPEHPLVPALTSDSEREPVAFYIRETYKKTELQRTGAASEEKTGVPLGVSAVHPLTGEKVPVWIADYVLLNYGTGAVMGVPAHDERDFAFAKKHGLSIRHVVAPPHEVSEARHEEAHHRERQETSNKRQGDIGAYTNDGVLVNSGEFTGLTSADARQKIADALASAERGRRQTNYHLRDWLVSRQRYWGAPIPIIYCETCGEVPVPEKDLPVKLPDDVDFRPTGESPLVRSQRFHKVKCPSCGKQACRESDTMDTFVDSSWYFLRYCDPKNKKEFAAKETFEYWCPVDLYVGGAEHAVMHLLYARFFTKALFDHGITAFEEPFLRLRNQGLVMGEDGQKMSKSRGNVVNPDEVVGEHGADAMRLYEMFMGDFAEAKPWSVQGILGMRRFLERAHGFVGSGQAGSEERDITARTHKTIKKVSEDIEAFKFNTAISALMIFLNELTVARMTEATRRFAEEIFVKLLSPFAPHIAEELWERLGHQGLVSREAWPIFDSDLARDQVVAFVVQVNGKLRETMRLSADASEEEVKAHALASPNVQKWLEGKEIKQVVFVKGRLINFVTA